MGSSSRLRAARSNAPQLASTPRYDPPSPDLGATLSRSLEAETAATALRAEVAALLRISPDRIVLRPTEEGFRVHGSNPAETECLSQALQQLGYLIRWRSPEFIAVKMGPGRFDPVAARAVRAW